MEKNIEGSTNNSNVRKQMSELPNVNFGLKISFLFWHFSKIHFGLSRIYGQYNHISVLGFAFVRRVTRSSEFDDE